MDSQDRFSRQDGGETYKRIGIVPNATILVGGPGAHGVIRVILLASNESRQEVCMPCQ
jgi:hypothetical protein